MARRPRNCSYEYELERYVRDMQTDEPETELYDVMRDLAMHVDLQTTEELAEHPDYECRPDELSPHRSMFIDRIVTLDELCGNRAEQDLNGLLDELAALDLE